MNQLYMPAKKKTKTKTKIKARRTRRRSTKKTTSIEPDVSTSFSASSRSDVIILPKGSLLYKQKLEKQFELRQQFEWFSETPGYGTAYGTFTDVYELVENLKLFDLGKGRAWLMNQYYDVNGADMCDEQYSGGEANMKFHKSIEAFLDQYEFHGTIVREATDSLDCGPSEIVLTPKTMKQTEHMVINKIRSTHSPNLTNSSGDRRSPSKFGKGLKASSLLTR